MDAIKPRGRLLRDHLLTFHCCQPVTSCPLRLPNPTVGREDLGKLINHPGVRAGALRRARDVDGRALSCADASPNPAKSLESVLGASTGSRGHLGMASVPSVTAVTENRWMALPGSISPPMSGLAGTHRAPATRWSPKSC